MSDPTGGGGANMSDDYRDRQVKVMAALERVEANVERLIAENDRLRAVARAEAASAQTHYEARLRLEAEVEQLQAKVRRLTVGLRTAVDAIRAT